MKSSEECYLVQLDEEIEEDIRQNIIKGMVGRCVTETSLFIQHCFSVDKEHLRNTYIVLFECGAWEQQREAMTGVLDTCK